MVELATPTWPEFSGAVRGEVTTAPVALAAPFEVMVPTFSADHSYEIRRWAARGLTIPAVGDEVLVVEDDAGLPWVPAWWPAGGDVPVASTTFPPLILVRAATTAALATNTAPTTKTLEALANGALAAQDGVTLAVGDRLLVKNEATGSHNGVYEVTSLGAAGSRWLLTRLSMMNESAEVVPGMLVAAAQGTQNGGVTFSLLTTGAITLGTTALTFGYASEWVAPTLLNSFVNYELGQATTAYRKSRDNRVQLRGLVKHTAAAAGLTIFTLPTGFRPSAGQIFSCWASVNGGTIVSVRIDVTAAGIVQFNGSVTAVDFLSLDQIGFYAD